MVALGHSELKLADIESWQNESYTKVQTVWIFFNAETPLLLHKNYVPFC